MRILIVRHGDPNYELDTLTETGSGDNLLGLAAAGYGKR